MSADNPRLPRLRERLESAARELEVQAIEFAHDKSDANRQYLRDAAVHYARRRRAYNAALAAKESAR